MWERGAPQAAAAAILIAYLLAKAIELNVRVWRNYPRHPVLVMLAGWFALSLLTAGAVLSFGSWFWDAMALTSFLFWTLASKITEVYYDPLLQEPVSREALLEDVLSHPWWGQQAA